VLLLRYDNPTLIVQETALIALTSEDCQCQVPELTVQTATTDTLLIMVFPQQSWVFRMLYGKDPVYLLGNS
jgi:hypothetical protein